jgi:hypothetical protein
MGQSKKIDSGPSYEASFSGMLLKYHKTMPMVQEQVFLTNSYGSFYFFGKGELMIVDCTSHLSALPKPSTTRGNQQYKKISILPSWLLVHILS